MESEEAMRCGVPDVGLGEIGFGGGDEDLVGGLGPVGGGGVGLPGEGGFGAVDADGVGEVVGAEMDGGCGGWES